MLAVEPYGVYLFPEIRFSYHTKLRRAQIIQRRLSSEEQERLAYLRQQNENGEITDKERQELSIYVDRIEQQDADRAEALIKLAQFRQIDLKVLIDEFLPTILAGIILSVLVI